MNRRKLLGLAVAAPLVPFAKPAASAGFVPVIWAAPEPFTHAERVRVALDAFRTAPGEVWYGLG